MGTLLEATYEIHNRMKFQEAGHFVPAMQDENCRRREWQGEEVHILTLEHDGRQILRCYGDSADTALNRMEDQIRETFFAMWKAQQIQSNNGAALMQAQTERNILADFIRAKHGQTELSTLLNETPTVPSPVKLVAVSDLGGDAA